MGLAVPPPEAREDSEDLRITLRAQNFVMGTEAITIGNLRRIGVAIDHRFLEVGRHVPPCILEKRDEIVGWMPGERVLEVEKSEFAATWQDHQVVGMIVAEHQNGETRDERQQI